ncbi:MAG: hypothetical protein A2X82_16615 [Geobacteraceae bacterium GWC2_55_20]|nr:MAG: hypothetical protein A2X82_16615 [Geobacteraceae bacterium GWC2_55_20]
MPSNGLLKNLTVLLVEDEKLPRESIGRFLSTKFAAVHLATNGLEGLDLFKLNHPDVVITDLEMPAMSGIEMIRRIRGRGDTLPIIITTGYDDDQHRCELADRVLIKPIIFSTLLDALVSCVRQRSGSGG